MLGLPKSTEYNKRVVKKKFYEKLDVNSKLRNIFITQIQSVLWSNKISPATINLPSGKAVPEIEIFVVKLTGTSLDKKVLSLLDNGIPYHSVFLLEFEGKFQAWAAYKEITAKKLGVKAGGKKEFTVKLGNYYHTDWFSEEKSPLKLKGLNLDSVYENLLRQIGGEPLAARKGETFKETVERDARIMKLQKRINALERKKRAEKQYNKRLKLNAEVKTLKKELGTL